VVKEPLPHPPLRNENDAPFNVFALRYYSCDAQRLSIRHTLAD